MLKIELNINHRYVCVSVKIAEKGSERGVSRKSKDDVSSLSGLKREICQFLSSKEIFVDNLFHKILSDLLPRYNKGKFWWWDFIASSLIHNCFCDMR